MKQKLQITIAGILLVCVVLGSFSAYWFEDTPVDTSKIHSKVAEQIRQNPTESVNVLIETSDKEEIIRKLGSNGEVIAETSDSVMISVKGNAIADIIDDNVQNVYPEVKYFPTLTESVLQIGANLAWDSGYKGDNIRVAVLDTGIDITHEMFNGKIIASKDFTNSENSYNDVVGHGTHIAGTVAGNGKYKGVAPNAQILNAKVIGDDGSGSNIAIVQAVEWAVSNNVDVIVMSFGSVENDDKLVKEIGELSDLGVVVVVSAGNCGEKCPAFYCGSYRGVTSPGNSRDAITVGAVDGSNDLACFSGEGEVDVVAPGVDIMSASPDGYVEKSGTSMSTAHVAGAVALLKQKDIGINVEDVKTIFAETSEDLGTFGKDSRYGYGLIDLGKTLEFDLGRQIEIDLLFKKEVEVGSIQEIKLSVVDDIIVDKVEGSVGDDTLVFNKIDDRDFVAQLNVDDEGIYVIESKVFLDGFVFEKKGEFGATKANSADVKIKSMDFNQVMYDKLKGEVVVEGNGDARVEVQLIDDEVVGLFTTDVEMVSGSLTFSVDEEINLAAGEYGLKVLVFYGKSVDVEESKIVVGDKEKPIVNDVDFNYGSLINSPYVVEFDVSDRSEISGKLIIINEDNVAHEVLLNDMAGTYYSKKPGKYSFSANICDISDNCVDTDTYSFYVEDCYKKSLLLMRWADIVAFDGVELDNYCVSELDARKYSLPDVEHLLNFDAVVFSSANSILPVDDSVISLLSNYKEKGGNLILEGNDVLTRQENLFYVQSTSEIYPTSNDLTMELVGEHDVTEGILGGLTLNPFAAFFPNSVEPVEGAVSLATWEHGGSAIIAAGDDSRVLLLPFALNSLEDDVSSKLIKNSLSWIMEQILYIAPGFGVVPDVVVNEGEVVEIKPDITNYNNQDPRVTIEDYRFFKEDDKFVWHTSKGDAGLYNVKVTALDKGGKVEEEFLVRVLSTNNVPIIEEISSINAREGELVSFSVVASDEDDDLLSYSISNGEFDIRYNVFSWKAKAGEHEFTVSVSDGKDKVSTKVLINVEAGYCSQIKCESYCDGNTYYYASCDGEKKSCDYRQYYSSPQCVNRNNKVPEVKEIANITVDEGSEVKIVVEASDYENTPLSYSISDDRFSQDGNTFVWLTDLRDSGEYMFTVTIVDAIAGVVNYEIEKDVYVTVNDVACGGVVCSNYCSGTTRYYNAKCILETETCGYDVQYNSEQCGFVDNDPLISAIGSVTIDENEVVVFDVVTLEANVNLIVNDERFKLIGNSFTWQTDYNSAGEYEIEVVATKGSRVDSEIVSVVVENINQAPMYNGGLSSSLLMTEDVAKELNVSSVFSDPDNDDLVFTFNDSRFSVNNLGYGLLAIVPDEDLFGQFNVVVIAYDGEDIAVSGVIMFDVVNTPEISLVNDVVEQYEYQADDEISFDFSIDDIYEMDKCSLVVGGEVESKFGLTNYDNTKISHDDGSRDGYFRIGWYRSSVSKEFSDVQSVYGLELDVGYYSSHPSDKEIDVKINDEKVYSISREQVESSCGRNKNCLVTVLFDEPVSVNGEAIVTLSSAYSFADHFRIGVDEDTYLGRSGNTKQGVIEGEYIIRLVTGSDVIRFKKQLDRGSYSWYGECYNSENEYKKTDSYSLTVVNSVPTSPSSVLPESGTFSNSIDVECSGSYDGDGDELTYTLWYKRGDIRLSEWEILEENGDGLATLDVSEMDGASLRLRCMANDGLSNSPTKDVGWIKVEN
jgi:hypothetical protein